VARIRSETGTWREQALAYARVGAELVRLLEATYETKIWSLNCDCVDGNLRYLDLGTLDDPTSDHPLGRYQRVVRAAPRTISIWHQGVLVPDPWPI